MVSRTHQIDGLLDALSDKGAVIVRTRLLAHRLFDKGLISQAVRDELLESLQTDALNQALEKGAEQVRLGQGAVVSR